LKPVWRRNIESHSRGVYGCELLRNLGAMGYHTSTPNPGLEALFHPAKEAETRSRPETESSEPAGSGIKTDGLKKKQRAHIFVFRISQYHKERTVGRYLSPTVRRAGWDFRGRNCGKGRSSQRISHCRKDGEKEIRREPIIIKREDYGFLFPRNLARIKNKKKTD